MNEQLKVTVLTLCNLSSNIYINSEPFTWYQSMDGKTLHFENLNTKISEYSILASEEFSEQEDGLYTFESQHTVLNIQFMCEVPLLPGFIAESPAKPLV